jgi:hypothetical protein
MALNCTCFIKLISNFFQFLLFVLVFVFLPTKGDYKKINIYLNETIKINQTILGFSIILFIYIFFFMILQFVYNSDNNQCIKGLMIFKLILSFIVWALSLAVISNINKILDSENIYSYSFEKLNLIKKDHIINLILILSANLLLNILDFLVIICGIFDSCCKKASGQSNSYNYPCPSANKDNNINSNQGRIVIVQYRETVISTTKINNN